MDLADAVEFDYPTAYGNIQAVRPGMQVFQVSSKTGIGMHAFLELLATDLLQIRASTVV
jgi:hydrogenase nickel incorporation protein HypB